MGRPLGKGPLAATWTIEDPHGVPVRVLRLLLVRLGAFQARFRQAAALLMDTSHPNLVRIHELVEVDGLVGVLTEYVPGGNLSDWLLRGDRSASRVVPMFHGIALGVGAAHGAGLLHRNLKPSKVLVTRVGEPKVAGFALGKITLPGTEAHTEAGTTFGTPQYMPPEQFRGAASVDERADLFALGCILYEMLSGHRAFAGDDLLALYKNVRASEYEPLPAGVPAGLVGIVADLLDPDPERRPRSVPDLLDRLEDEPELRGLLQDVPTLQAAPAPPERPPALPVPPPPPLPIGSAPGAPLSPVEDLGAGPAESPPPLPRPEVEGPSAELPPDAPAVDRASPYGVVMRSAPVQPRRRGGPPSLPPPPLTRTLPPLDKPESPGPFGGRRSPVTMPPRPQPLADPEFPPRWQMIAVAMMTIAVVLAIAAVVMAIAMA